MAKSVRRVRCWNCNGVGRIAKDCTKPKKVQVRMNKPSEGGKGKGKNFFLEETEEDTAEFWSHPFESGPARLAKEGQMQTL